MGKAAHIHSNSPLGSGNDVLSRAQLQLLIHFCRCMSFEKYLQNTISILNHKLYTARVQEVVSFRIFNSIF